MPPALWPERRYVWVESPAVPMKAAPQYKTPPQHHAALLPDRGIHVAVEGVREVLRVRRWGGYPAWSALASEMTMEDRT